MIIDDIGCNYWIWKFWCDGMLEQGRYVASERMNWNTLPEQDRQLDAMIAKQFTMKMIELIQRINTSWGHS